MEQKTLEQIIQDVKDALNKAIIELAPLEDPEDSQDQAGSLREALAEMLTITPLKDPDEYEEIMSSDEYYDSGC